MSQIIYKYNLSIKEERSIPKDSKILKVDLQHGNLCLWALTSTDTREQCKIEIYYTGSTLKEGLEHEHLGTFLLQNGDFVVHVFKTIEL